MLFLFHFWSPSVPFRFHSISILCLSRFYSASVLFKCYFCPTSLLFPFHFHCSSTFLLSIPFPCLIYFSFVQHVISLLVFNSFDTSFCFVTVVRFFSVLLRSIPELCVIIFWWFNFLYLRARLWFYHSTSSRTLRIRRNVRFKLPSSVHFYNQVRS